MTTGQASGAEPVDADDPKGLVREAYRIEGITAGECRSIFLDWALSLPAGVKAAAAAGRLHAGRPHDHPMTAVLAEGASTRDTTPSRRGGWRSRPRD